MNSIEYDKKLADYMTEASERYDAGNKYDVSDFRNFISNLENTTQLDLVCRCVFQKHPYKSFPKYANIMKYLRESNISIREKSNTVDEDYCYKCKVCGAFFETELGWCPSCYKKGVKNTPAEPRLLKDDMYVLKGHSGCAVCPKWSERNMACCCHEWGTGRYDEMCKDCDCLECCKDERLRQTDYRAYKIKHNLMGTRIMDKDVINRG